LEKCAKEHIPVNMKQEVIKALCMVLDNYIECRDASHKYKSVLEKMKGLTGKDPDIFRYYGLK